MTGKPDPAKQPIVHKLRGGGVVAWTTEIDAFIGRNRHDNILAACRKVRDEFKDTDPDFFAAHFIEGEYTAKNGQKYLQWGLYRAGFVAMMKHIHNVADKTVLYLAAYDRKADAAEKRASPDPETVPDDPAALELAAALSAVPPALEEYLPPLNDPVVHVDGMRAYATTMDIAAFFRKRHDHVLASVREILSCQPEFGLPNFREITYSDSHGREQPAFEVTKAGFTVVVGRFTGAEALAFQIRYVQRFEEMEAALKAQQPTPTHPELPHDFLSALKALVMSEEQRAALATANAAQAQQVAALSAEKTELHAKLAEQEQWLEQYRRLVNSDGLILPSDLAKVMHIPQQEFFDRLYKADYIFQRAKPGNRKGRWLAKAQWIKKGLFDHKIYQQRLPDGTDKERPQLYVTSKGVKVIAMLFGKDDSGQGRLMLGMH